MALRGAPSGAPSIEWGVAPGDLSLPGSMVRVAEGEDWLHVAAVAAPIELCNAALGGDDLLREVGLLSAPDLGVTLLPATTPSGADRSEARRVGKEGVGPVGSRGWPCYSKNKTQ